MKIYIISILAVMLVCLSGENILADQSLYPLEPADRSSPRATLQTFLDDMNKAVEEYKAIMVERLLILPVAPPNA